MNVAVACDILLGSFAIMAIDRPLFPMPLNGSVLGWPSTTNLERCEF